MFLRANSTELVSKPGVPTKAAESRQRRRMATKQKLSLKALTKDDIEMAFEKTRKQYEMPGVKLVLITEEYYERALGLCRDYFVPLEPINKALGLQYTEEFSEFWLQCLKRHLSLMFVDEISGDSIASLTINIVCHDDAFHLDSIKDKPFRDVFTFLAHCEEMARFFDHSSTGEVVDLFSVVVAEKYMRRGFASKISLASIDMIRNFGFDEVYVKGGGTSNFSKKIFEQFGFEALYEGRYDQYEINGKFPIQDTGEHKSMIVYGLKVTQNERN